ncbi:MAG: NUDIX domain-containing protein, partial [Turicibacter sp.]|nr:NUDIX domain-containing protein [Turicibacter sp.]
MLETTLCYIFKNSEILMLYRNKKENDVHEGKWNGLGGKLEKEETPLQCVLREVYEESGLRLVNPTLI